MNDVCINGGFIEGFRKIFKGANALRNNLFVFGYSAVSGMGIAMLLQPQNAPQQMGEMSSTMPVWLYLLAVLIGLPLGGYMLNSIHQCIVIIRAYLRGDTRADNFGLLADISIPKMFKFLLGLICVGFVWCLYFIVPIILAACFLAITSPVLFWIFSTVCALLSIPAIGLAYVKYAESYNTIAALNPIPVLKLIFKTWLPLSWVYLRFIGFSLIVSIIMFLFLLVFTFIPGGIIVPMVVQMYLTMLLSIVFYYAVAYVYCKNS